MGAVQSAGAVNVLYGSPTGLDGTSSQLFTQDSAGIGSTVEGGDVFGYAPRRSVTRTSEAIRSTRDIRW